MDIGIEALNAVHTILETDEEWTTRRPRGFTWWGHRLAQHVEVGSAVESHGFTLYGVTSRVLVLQDVEAPSEDVERALANLNKFSAGACYFFEPGAREVWSAQRTAVHAETVASRVQGIAGRTILQLIDAERDADALVEPLGGSIAASCHATSGRREVPDEMLSLVDAYFSPEGQLPSRFRNAFEFETILETLESVTVRSFGASEAGFGVNLRFGSGEAMLRASAVELHPQLGSGLCVYAQLPEWMPCEGSVRLANWLNRYGANDRSAGSLHGAWCVRRLEDRYAVTHVQFVPNALFRPGVAMDTALTVARKLILTDRLLNGSRTHWQRDDGPFGMLRMPHIEGDRPRSVQ